MKYLCWNKMRKISSQLKIPFKGIIYHVPIQTPAYIKVGKISPEEKRERKSITF